MRAQKKYTKAEKLAIREKVRREMDPNWKALVVYTPPMTVADLIASPRVLDADHPQTEPPPMESPASLEFPFATKRSFEERFEKDWQEIEELFKQCIKKEREQKNKIKQLWKDVHAELLVKFDETGDVPFEHDSRDSSFGRIIKYSAILFLLWIYYNAVGDFSMLGRYILGFLMWLWLAVLPTLESLWQRLVVWYPAN